MNLKDLISEAFSSGEDSARLQMKKKALQEKEKQAVFPKKEETSKEPEQKKSEPSATVKDETESVKGVPKLENVIEKINSLRAGKSLKDEVVFNEFKRWFESLSDNEKTSLYIFMKGVAQIIAGGASAEDVDQPDDSPSNIEMKKDKPDNKKHIEPNVIKKSSIDGVQKAKSIPGVEKDNTPLPVKTVRQK